MSLQFAAEVLLGLPGAIAALLTPCAPVTGGTPAHRLSYPHTLQSQNVRQLWLEQRMSDLAIIYADICPTVKTPPCLQRLASSLPGAGPELHNLWDVTEEAGPPEGTVTVVGKVTAPIDTAGVSHARVTRVP